MEAGDKNEFENKNSSKWYNVRLNMKMLLVFRARCWWTQNVTKWNWHMNAVFLALCNNSDAFKQINLLCPKFYGRNSHSSDIYLNKPQSIRIIKIGFDYILSIFIICWLILNFGLNSFCSHRRLYCTYGVFCTFYHSIHFVLGIKLFACVCVCVDHFYPNR